MKRVGSADPGAMLEVARAVVEAASAGEEVEAYAQWTRETRVRVSGGEVEAFSEASAGGVGVRVFRGARVGFSFTTDLSPGGLKGCLDEARGMARAVPDLPDAFLPGRQEIRPLEGIFQEDPAEVGRERKVAIALEIERAALGSAPEVVAVEEALYADQVEVVAMASTRGLSASYVRSWYSVSCSAMARRGEETGTGFAYGLARSLGELSAEAVGAGAGGRAARSLGAVKPPTRRLPVVFDPLASVALLSALAEALSGEVVEKGRSFLAGRLGEAVGPSWLYLLDDGRDPASPLAAPFDDEGVPTRSVPLISGGRLLSFLHNSATARRAGAAAGNARRRGFRGIPRVGARGFRFSPTGPKEKALREAAEGVYVTEVLGAHSGINPASGDFSVGVRGFLVEAGELGQPVREATVASPLMEMLGGICFVGDDLVYLGPLGGSTLVVAEMTLAGV